jgi:hypothetical protein
MVSSAFPRQGNDLKAGFVFSLDMLYKKVILSGRDIWYAPALFIHSSSNKPFRLCKKGKSCIYLKQKMGISGSALPVQSKRRP